MVLLPHQYLIMYRLYYKSGKVTSSGVRVELNYDLIIGERMKGERIQQLPEPTSTRQTGLTLS